jgi:Reverse transcriptase (RNA-dependent DNA polymerase)
VLIINQLQKNNSIKNYYESVNHSKFIESICNAWGIKKDSLIVRLLESNLKIVFKNTSGEITRKETGFAIGLKPDEYFAELYMYLITNRIKEVIDSDVINIADELLFFAGNLNEVRAINDKIEQEIKKFDLEINRSKNKSIYNNIPEIKNSKELTLDLYGLKFVDNQ